MGHCKDCKNAIDASWRSPGIFTCDRIKDLVWIDGDAYDACVVLEPDFGCVLFEAKE